MKKINLTALGFSSLILILSCGESGKSGDSPTKDEPSNSNEISEETVASGGNVLKLKNQLFSIPSPVQTAILIRDQKIPFNEDLISDFSKTDTYVTTEKQALNLGVLGSDLAYLSNYNDLKRSASCLSSVEALSEKLNIQANIDPSLLKRFNENMNNADSLNALNSMFYRNAERYLEENLQNESSVLILLGGWAESMHFATQSSENEFLRERVAEQKNVVKNLSTLLEGLESPLVKKAQSELSELVSIYDELKQNYEYKESITDQKEKTTYIKSKSSTELTDEQLNRIKNSISSLRDIITA